MGIRIVVGQREAIGLALRRLRKQLDRQGVLWEMRRRTYFADAGQTRRAKQFRKRLKARRATLEEQKAGVQPVTSLAAAAEQLARRSGKP